MTHRISPPLPKSRRKPFFIWAIAVALVSSFLVVAAPAAAPAEALSGSNFDPGYIISDSNFYTTGAMSEVEIQSFLDANIGTCRNTLCLNVLRIDTTTTTLSFGTCATYQGQANESAARMIYKVQQACAISAKVLLVTLQKEQGLVTSKAPTEAVLRKALGQGCPDTAQCDSAYYGFFMQVYSAARQFAWYGNPEGSHTSIKVGQQNAVRFHPTAACGSSNVVIQNRATASLYYYTPYQPNTAALNNLGGVGDSCSSYGNRNFWVYYNNWFGSPSGQPNPLGDFNSIVATPDPIQTHVYINNIYSVTVPANQSRPDVETAYPGQGAKHGFATNIWMPVGTSSVCVYGINVGPGVNARIGCKTVTVVGAVPAVDRLPQGDINSATVVATRDGVALRGWAFDPDTTAPSRADVWVNGKYRTTLTANLARPDVKAAFPAQGANHGFASTIALGAGNSQVCVYAINVGRGTTHPSIGCQNVSILRPGTNPTGSINEIARSADTASIRGWAFDSDSKSPILVDAWVNGAYRQTLTANVARPDVQAAFPNQGANHGFTGSVGLASGSNNICLYGINVGGGSHTLLGCRNIVVTANNPIGSVDAVSASGSNIAVRGWTFDADTTESILADVWINGRYAATLNANASRPDVQAAYRGQSANHGFVGSIPASPGTNSVCIYGINNAAGANPLLGCRTVTVTG
jgi:hypothetical protein